MLNSFRSAVEATVSAGWTTTPIYYGTDAPHVVEASWVRVNVYPSTNNRVSIGGSYFDREIGFVRVEIYVIEDEGAGKLMDYYDTLAGLFRGQTIGGAVFRSPTYSANGRDGGWIRATMDVPYQRDECF